MDTKKCHRVLQMHAVRVCREGLESERGRASTRVYEQRPAGCSIARGWATLELGGHPIRHGVIYSECSAHRKTAFKVLLLWVIRLLQLCITRADHPSHAFDCSATRVDLSTDGVQFSPVLGCMENLTDILEMIYIH